MMPVTIKAFYGTWLEREESERQERNAAATTKLNTSSVRLYQAAGADLGILGHHRVIFFLFYVNESTAIGARWNYCKSLCDFSRFPQNK